MKNTVRLNFEFPREAYPYLKMVCALEGVSLKDFATELIIKEIEKYEDNLLLEKAQKRLAEMDEKGTVSFDEACEQAGWESDEKL